MNLILVCHQFTVLQVTIALSDLPTKSLFSGRIAWRHNSFFHDPSDHEIEWTANKGATTFTSAHDTKHHFLIWHKDSRFSTWHKTSLLLTFSHLFKCLRLDISLRTIKRRLLCVLASGLPWLGKTNKILLAIANIEFFPQ